MEARIPAYKLKYGQECACPACKRVFSSLEAFDAHRVGTYSGGKECAQSLCGKANTRPMELDTRGRWRIKRESA